MYRFLTSRLVRVATTSVAGLLAAGALATSASAAVAPAIDRNWAAPTSTDNPSDPFYTPPSPIPAGNPGDVLRARPSKAGPPAARSLANAWQVMYLSTDALGQPNVVTGTVMVPKGKDPATVPVVAINPGTTGPAFRCTVSRFINQGAFYEQSAVNDMLRAGYAVAVTDYEGYHENPTTTYILGKAMGPAVLDMIRAAERLPEAGLSSNAKVAIRGFSQGGGASAWAGQLQPTYAPELNLVGIAAGGVPANLASVALGLEGKPAFGFELNALIGLDNAYPELLLENYLLPEGKTTLANMEANDCTIELLLDYENKTSEDYTDPSPFGESAWLARVTENALGTTKIEVPLLQYHAQNDPIVAYKQAKSLRDKYCALGVAEYWDDTYTTGHVTTVGRANPQVAAFIADRLAGKPFTSNC